MAGFLKLGVKGSMLLCPISPSPPGTTTISAINSNGAVIVRIVLESMEGIPIRSNQNDKDVYAEAD